VGERERERERERESERTLPEDESNVVVAGGWGREGSGNPQSAATLARTAAGAEAAVAAEGGALRGGTQLSLR